MTKGTSPWNEGRQLDLTEEVVKSFLTWGYENYELAFKENNQSGQNFYSGYVRALHHLLEAEGQ